MEKRYILFDLDGTLTDSCEGIINAFRYGLEKASVKSDIDDYRFIIGPPLADSLQHSFGLGKEKADEVIGYFREYYGTRGKYENTPYPGIPEMLRVLNAHGKKLMVATAKPEVFAVDIIDHYELSDCFCFVAGVDHDSAMDAVPGRRVTKDDVIDYILRSNDIKEPEKTVMVGDRADDIIAGKKKGLLTIGVTYGYGTKEELIQAGADFIADTPEKLAEIIIED